MRVGRDDTFMLFWYWGPVVGMTFSDQSMGVEQTESEGVIDAVPSGVLVPSRFVDQRVHDRC